MTHDEALAFLYGRIDYEKATVLPYNARDFKLERMRELLARLGSPERDLPIVHVAGTKGKGSTSAMIAACLTAAGHRTGLFSSPHLVRVEERLRIDGDPCTPEEFVELTSRVKAVAEEMDRSAGHAADDPSGPTYFELTTAMAILHFVAADAAFAVLEVGMGGRLDSTNVCQPRVAVITSISFDHTKQLGNTLAAIAGEKAGIVKPGVPTVSGVTQDEPRAVIEAVCRERGSPLVQLGRDFDFEYAAPQLLDGAALQGRMSYWRNDGREEELCDMSLGLLGRHQAANGAVAMAALGELQRQGWSIPERAVRSGLANVRWPARVEVIGRQPTVILDAAHNVASVDALLETLAESFAPRRSVLVFGTTKDKDVRGMLGSLLPRFDDVVFTRYLKNPRAVAPEELRRLAEGLGKGDCQLRPDPASAWRLARDLAQASDLICITGSFFLAAELREVIDGEHR